jgi:hypothetical protein
MTFEETILFQDIPFFFVDRVAEYRRLDAYLASKMFI